MLKERRANDMTMTFCDKKILTQQCFCSKYNFKINIIQYNFVFDITTELSKTLCL